MAQLAIVVELPAGDADAYGDALLAAGALAVSAEDADADAGEEEEEEDEASNTTARLNRRTSARRRGAP